MNATNAIYSLSHLASQPLDLDQFAEGAVEILVDAGATEATLTLTNPVSDTIAQAARKRALGEEGAGFLTARDVVVRGVRYGRFEMKLAAGSASALLVADTIAAQLARFAELDAARARQQQWSAFVKTSALELAARKLLSRASGLFVNQKKEQARRAA